MLKFWAPEKLFLRNCDVACIVILHIIVEFHGHQNKKQIFSHKHVSVVLVNDFYPNISKLPFIETLQRVIVGNNPSLWISLVDTQIWKSSAFPWKFLELHVRNFQSQIPCLLWGSYLHVFDSLCLKKWCNIMVS